MEVTKWLKPSISVSRIGDNASVQAATRVKAEQASKRSMLSSKGGMLFEIAFASSLCVFVARRVFASKIFRCGSEREVAPHPGVAF